MTDVTLTIGKLLAAMEALGPRDTWRVSRLFSPSNITLCKASGESLYLIHPSMVFRIERVWNENLTPDQRRNPLFQFSAMEIDAHESDDETTAEWRGRERMRVMDILSQSLTAHIGQQKP